ncbi:MAG: putative Ig domain-containing protein [Candidatus Vogelbacteria bacterium]|nr:putative Ig domain-containing protein [Candidatus Vogelbacteria bacterium]
MKKYIVLAIFLALFVVAPVLAQVPSGQTLDDYIEGLRVQIARLTEQLNQLLAQQRGNSCYEFGFDFSMNTTSNQSVDFQQQKLGSVLRLEGLPDVKSFQAKYGIKQTGYVGPLTRGQLNKLYGCNRGAYITPNALPVGKVNERYSNYSSPEITVHGLSGTISWSVISGALPPGLNLEKTILVGIPENPPPPAESYRAFIWGTPTTAGTYTFTVQATNGTQTATQNYTLTVLGNNQNAPVISGISGPTTLKVGEQGTWTVNATDPNNGTLGYSISWGDTAGTASSPSQLNYQQTTTFQHAYYGAGAYTITVRVQNQQGLITTSTITVNVGEKLSIVSPVGDVIWPVGSSQTISWNYNGTVPSGAYLSIGLRGIDQTTQGQGGLLTSVSNPLAQGSKTFVVPDTLFSGDVAFITLPGKYKLSLILIDHQSCIPYAPSCLYPPSHTLAETEMNGTVNITNNQPQITVTSPNGGEVWAANSVKPITWFARGAEVDRPAVSKVDLYLIDYMLPCTSMCPLYPSRLYNLDKNIAMNAVYNWIVATDIVNNPIPVGQYYVRVCLAGTNTCDSSDRPFTITAQTY